MRMAGLLRSPEGRWLARGKLETSDSRTDDAVFIGIVLEESRGPY